MNIPRPEHPFPQFERENWANLNGEWEFEFDFGNSGRDRKCRADGRNDPDTPGRTCRGGRTASANTGSGTT